MSKSVGNLSLVEKVGQMFMIGLDGCMPDDTVMELIQTYKIGGFLIYENNVKSAEQLLRLINSLKSMNSGNEIPLFIAVAHEGGRMNVIPSEIIKLPAIKYIAESADKNLIYEVASIIATVLKAFGINMNFCPLLDLGGIVGGKSLGDRCISSNPTIVSSYGLQMINGLNEQGIIAVPKYFPGHGSTKNTKNDFIIPSTKKSIVKLEQADIVPFRTAIDAKIDAMMVGHINLSRLNLFAPATMSYKVVTKLLKQRYGYNGIVVADNLTATCVDIQYGIKASARKAILAGCDLMLIKDTRKVKGVLLDIAKQVRLGNISDQEIDFRVQKILDLKDKFNIKDEEITEINIKELNDQLEQVIKKIKK